VTGVVDQLLRWLRREKADVQEALEDTRRRGEADLDRRERQLHETPEEGVARLQDDIRANDEAFDELRRKLGDSGTGPGPGPDAGPGPRSDGS
jgi:hypothetical protein